MAHYLFMTVGEIGKYKIYDRGQICLETPIALTRLKSPKPKLVPGNPMKSIVSTWKNSLLEMINKYNKRIKHRI